MPSRGGTCVLRSGEALSSGGAARRGWLTSGSTESGFQYAMKYIKNCIKHQACTKNTENILHCKLHCLKINNI